MLRKSKKSFVLKEYKNCCNIRATKFHIWKYKEVLSGWIFLGFSQIRLGIAPENYYFCFKNFLCDYLCKQFFVCDLSHSSANFNIVISFITSKHFPNFQQNYTISGLCQTSKLSSSLFFFMFALRQKASTLADSLFPKEFYF